MLTQISKKGSVPQQKYVKIQMKYTKHCEKQKNQQKHQISLRKKFLQIQIITNNELFFIILILQSIIKKRFIMVQFLQLFIKITLIFQLMEKTITIQEKWIGQKCFRLAIHNLQKCEKYMLPKLDNAPVHHTFFSPQALDQLYKENNIDLEELNKKKDPFSIKEQQKVSRKVSKQEVQIVPENLVSKASIQAGRKRPPIRQNGFTHFIQISLSQFIKEAYQNQIVPNIEQQDLGLLLPLQRMHITLLTFRLKKQQDLQQWQNIMSSVRHLKKGRTINIKGVGIFGPKQPYARVLYLKVQKLEQIIDLIVRKALEQNLIKQQELQHIKFDKAKDMFMSEQPHITILQNKGTDLTDATNYLKKFKDINLNKFYVNELKLSIIGSFDGKDFFHESVVQLGKP